MEYPQSLCAARNLKKIRASVLGPVFQPSPRQIVPGFRQSGRWRGEGFEFPKKICKKPYTGDEMKKLKRADQENQTAIAATKLARNIRFMANRFPDDPSMQSLIQLCRYVDDLSDYVIKYRNDIVKLKHKLSTEIQSKLTT